MYCKIMILSSPLWVSSWIMFVGRVCCILTLKANNTTAIAPVRPEMTPDFPPINAVIIPKIKAV